MADAGLESRIADVRRFTRFYTQRAGVLQPIYAPFSLTEARVLFELAGREGRTASDIRAELGLDAGYLSRILRRFESKGLLRKSPAEDDARRRLLALTERGAKAFARLDARSREEVGAMLAPLRAADQDPLLAAMATVERLLGAPGQSDAIAIAPPRPGDAGWVIARHGALYAQEYGFDAEFEALVAEIVLAFMRSHDAARERCWIAKRGGENVGSVFLVRETETVAKLRLLIVEPSARGLGVGHRLVEACLGFAREAGYRKVALWTQQNLTAARRIYEQAGFQLVREEPHRSFGQDLVGEYWELTF